MSIIAAFISLGVVVLVALFIWADQKVREGFPIEVQQRIKWEVRRVIGKDGKKREYVWIVNELHLSATELARKIKDAGELVEVDVGGVKKKVYRMHFDRELVEFWEDPGPIDKSGQ